jgi:PAS domain S-box-containing protein
MHERFHRGPADHTARPRGEAPAPARRGLAAATTYAAACLVPAIVFPFQVALQRHVALPYALFYPAVMLVALLGGLGPGLLASTLAALLAARWILPSRGLVPSEALGLALFVAGSASISVLAHLAKQARRRLAEREKASALRAAEERCQIGRAQLEAVFHAMRDGVVVLDMAGNAVLVNEAAARCDDFPGPRGVDGGVTRGSEFYEILDREGRPLPVERWPVSRVLAGESVADEELRVRRRDTGQESHVSVAGEPVRDAAGEQVLAVLVNHVITERKVAEMESERLKGELARRAAQLEATFECAPDALAVLGRSGEVLQVNSAARRILGVDDTRMSEPMEQRIQRLQPHDPDARPIPPERTVSARVLRGETVRNEVIRVTHPSGAFRWLSLSGAPIRLPGGERIGALVLGSDITEQMRAEEALREESRRKNEFLGVLSHELRNPLAAIRSSVYTLNRIGASSAEAAGVRETIQRQTEHLSLIVDDLLDVTRITRGRIELRRRRFDLRALVRQSCEDNRAAFEKARVELRRREPGDPVWIDGDATRISQVLGNLLQNAARFTPAGGAVDVQVERRDSSAEMRVRDTGIGMVDEELEHLFEPFSQPDQGLARTQGGLGLGLALSKGLVDLHGGSIHATSAGRGRGSEFLVRFPLAPGRGPGAEAPERREEPAAGRLVLLIEDNADTCESLSLALGLSGHDVRAAHDGGTGLAMAREIKPDVVLCDIGLPDIDGYEVARRLRADEALRSTFLVALSGYARPEDKARAKEAGFDAHIAKPPEIEELSHFLMSRLCERSGGPPPSG